MENVSLNHFVDYVLTSGTGRLTSVKRLKHGETAAHDLYKPVRDAIVDMHTGGHDTIFLNAICSRADPVEKRIFPKVVSGYKRFLRQAKMTWFEPPMRDYSLGPIYVRVNPEIGLLIDGRPHVIQLYFMGDPLSPQRTMMVNQLLSDAMGHVWPRTQFATLDVRRGKIFPHRPKREIAHLLRAEALSFSNLYSLLD